MQQAHAPFNIVQRISTAFELFQDSSFAPILKRSKFDTSIIQSSNFTLLLGAEVKELLNMCYFRESMKFFKN